MPLLDPAVPLLLPLHLPVRGLRERRELLEDPGHLRAGHQRPAAQLLRHLAIKEGFGEAQAIQI